MTFLATIVLAAGAAWGGGQFKVPVAGEVKVLQLRPAQMSVGMREVLTKVAEIQDMKAGRLDDYLRREAVPLVSAPDRRLYLPNKNHHARAAWEAGISKIYYSVLTDWSGLSEEEFWGRMKANGWVYLQDQFGRGPHEPADLPEDVRGFADDPYRSVAGVVRDRGGYQKTAVYFAEFQWADFFRKNLTVHPHQDFDTAVSQAVPLAKDPRAKGLPGYSGP